MEDDSGSSILVISCESGSSARVENKMNVDDLVSLFLLFSFVYRGLEFYLLVILDIMGQSLT